MYKQKGGEGQGVDPRSGLSEPIPDPHWAHTYIEFLGISLFEATLHPVGSYSASVH